MGREVKYLWFRLLKIFAINVYHSPWYTLFMGCMFCSYFMDPSWSLVVSAPHTKKWRPISQLVEALIKK